MIDHKLYPIAISIVLPAYNAASDIRRCIDSLLAQTFNSFEIIAVDDGSTDDTATIIAAYQGRSERIELLRIEHRGVSVARNIALDRCRGEFVGFVDADDTTAPDMYSRLYDAAIRREADVVRCGYLEYSEPRLDRASEAQVCGLLQAEYSSFPDTVREYLTSRRFFALWNGLYRRSLFDNVRFVPERGSQDMPVQIELSLRANRVVFIDNVLYSYRKRCGSITTTLSPKRFDLVWACRAIEQILSRVRAPLSIRVLAARLTADALVGLLIRAKARIRECPKVWKRAFFLEISRGRLVLLSFVPGIRLRTRLSFLCCAISFSLYWAVDPAIDIIAIPTRRLRHRLLRFLAPATYSSFISPSEDPQR